MKPTTTIASAIAGALLLAGCNGAGTQLGAPAASDDRSACAEIIAQARAVGDPLTGGTELYERHLLVCHDAAPQAPPAPTTAPPRPIPNETPATTPGIDLVAVGAGA